MENAGTQTIATFTGTLLRREHTVGQKFVQLVFRENDKDWLCISTDSRTAKLLVGQKYRIEGMFKSLGQRSYIHEPRIVAVAERHGRAKRIIISTVVVLLVAAMSTAAVRVAHGALTPTSAESNETAKHIRQTSAPQVPAASTDTSQQQAATPPAPTPPKTPAKAAAVKPQVPTPPAATPQAPVSTPPAAYCDAPVTVPFDKKTVEDNTQPVGYSEVTQTGVDGQTQTCYPGGPGTPGQTTVITAEQDQITTVGPAS